MSIKAYRLAKEWARNPQSSILYITASEKAAEIFRNDLEFFAGGLVNGGVCFFPSPDELPYTHLTTQQDIWIDRLRVLYRLFMKDNLAIVAPVEAVLRKCPPKWIFDRYRRTIHLNDQIDRDEMAAFLTECGYVNQPLVEDEGSFSMRGGIFDLFTPTMERPVRMEFYGDDLVSMRTFDPSTQRSSFGISSLTIIPARNVILSRETRMRAISSLKELCDRNDIRPTERRELAENIEQGFYAQAVETLMPLFYDGLLSITDYLPEGSVVRCDDDIECRAEKDRLFQRLKKARDAAKHIEKIIEPELLYDTEVRCQVSDAIGPASVHPYLAYGIEPLASGIGAQRTGKDIVSSAVKKIKDIQQLGFKIIVTCRTATQAERMLDLLRWNGLASEITEKRFSEALELGRSVVRIVPGKLSSGFVSEEERLAVITDEDIFGTKVSKRTATETKIETFTDFSQLTEGDYVVHRDHGIGRYLGLRNLEIAGTKNDFLEIQYLGNDKLLLPVWRINLISRYIGSGNDANVALDRLGGTRWTKTQAKVSAAIRTMAMELLKIYASRRASSGFSFTPRDRLLEEFEAAFSYDETPDQWRAIEETLADMQAERPADRLICGDVGYGKTEVAMRAAFKAVTDKKQVAILVPTTVLAFQHYENFMNRFANWPVRIEMLSRFRTRTEQKHIINELSRGMVDIVIGTHRILQRDVKFSDLGLLIIDEEHRFGVAHKERIRKLKAGVDTITMTATPIPRTLHMSLSGIRDISIISTPPVNRLAIRTYIAEFDESLIRGAIMAELSRGGQVFFVHNRVETIGKMHDLLVRLVPEAKIAVGHGQMEEHELEDVMIKFLEKKANVLLCTTIIESGLDVPSANTIIINRADTMGLAQLYQLRGRVGRSNIQAYAYLLTPSGTGSFIGTEEIVRPKGRGYTSGISPVAARRLALLQRYTELGSGFQIAMHDLEIRGSGNILGAQQSGHINAIGFEMYNELLEKAVRQLQGKPEEIKLDVEINLPIPAYLPADYVEDQGQRLVLYRKLAAVDSISKLDDVSKEIEDRYGPLPELAKNLLSIVEIRVKAKELMIESINYDGRVFTCKFNGNTPVKPEKIIGLVKKDPNKFTIKPPSTLVMRAICANSKEILMNLRDLLNSMAA